MAMTNPPSQNLQELQAELRNLMDGFLVESQRTNGETIVRSLDRLNQDRQLFIQQAMAAFTRELEKQKAETVELVEKRVIGVDEVELTLEGRQRQGAMSRNVLRRKQRERLQLLTSRGGQQ